MPTITEIRNPDLTYCKDRDAHCLCPKCNKCPQCHFCKTYHERNERNERTKLTPALVYQPVTCCIPRLKS